MNLPNSNQAANAEQNNKEVTSKIQDKEENISNLPYLENRIIRIALATDIEIKSVYRQVNSKVINDRHDNIGSSITSTNMLMSNGEEVASYFPNILGLAANHPDFTQRVKAWFSNISVRVEGDGKDFNCSFNWNKKSDYNAFKNEEDEIEEAYLSADKSNPKLLKDAIIKKVEALHVLESKRYKFGRPVNIADYLIYRHCLLYKDVAKDISVISFSPNCRFYIRDEARENARAAKHQLSIVKAKRNYLEIYDNTEKFNQIFVCYCALSNFDILTYLNLDNPVKQKMLDEFSVKEPDKFNNLFLDKNIKLRAMIETAIAKGELLRSPNNQNILTNNGDYIGANMKEAIVYFMNPNNADFMKTLEIKLKY
jgi:hypothetical protein